MVYFVVLLVVTLRKQLAHMVKHRYMPCSWGKPTYKGGKAPGGATGGAGAAAAAWKGASS